MKRTVVIGFLAVDLNNAWDFEEVFARPNDFARGYPFDPDTEEYIV